MAKKEENKRSNWVVVGDSVIGLSHIKNNTPCQDSHYYNMIDANWGVAIVADGAGSVEAAHKGAKYLAQEAGKMFQELVIQQKWNSKQTFPDQTTWHHLAKNTLLELRSRLGKVAVTLQLDVKSLSSTIVVLLHSPQGLLCTHIGDGRAGYANHQQEWKSIIQPWKGEYVNETVFMSSDIWEQEQIDRFVKSYVIHDSIKAFTLMSDGCERHSFICNVWDEKKQRYVDPNLPFDKFFNPVTNNLLKMYQNGSSPQEMKKKWAKFLTEGNPKLKHEPDDKTMIIGVQLQKE